jgi:hypothetical protein
MPLRTIEEFKQFNRIYDLLLVWKDSEKSEDIKNMQNVLEECGFWANSKEEETKFLIPFQENRRSYILTAPQGWEIGEFPLPGDYSFARVTKEGNGPRQSFIEFSVFNFTSQEYFSVAKYTRGYLFTFLEEKKKLCLHNYSIITDKNSPYYKKYLKMQKREEEIKQACMKFVPELTFYTWPDELEISGDWEEKARSDPDFFKKKFEMLSSEYYSHLPAWTFTFHSLAWENKTSQITKEITYTAVDENARYMYGVIEKKEYRKDIGVWLKQEREFISFEVQLKVGQSSFTKFQGKLFPKRIEFTIPFYSKGPKAKSFYVQHFAQFGLSITNLYT